jgi:hypothetical protein
MPSLSRRLLPAALLAAAAVTARAAEPDIVYPAKVTTTQGRIIPIENLGHEFGVGSFVYYDGETEGRVQWRDLDRITFIGNLGHVPGANAPQAHGTERATLKFLDGTEKQVNLVVGQLHGYDGVAVRDIPGRNLAVIDFDEARIAPKLYKTCLRGHVWEQPDYHYCPYDGLTLDETRLR